VNRNKVVVLKPRSVSSGSSPNVEIDRRNIDDPQIRKLVRNALRRKNMRYLRTKLTLLLGLGALAVFAVAAYAATTLILAVGTISDSEFFGGPATVTVRTLTIPAGEVGAWHYHPGYAFNVVKSGTLTVEDGCGGPDENLTQGQAFEELDGRVHRAKNLGTDPVLVYNTFIVPQGSPTTVNIPNNERQCGPPENTDECKLNGWMNFTYPQSFDNQGACVDWVLHRPRNTVPVPEPLTPSGAAALLTTDAIQ
jgi:quercetin dioxygenase-like cupin family protein